VQNQLMQLLAFFQLFQWVKVMQLVMQFDAVVMQVDAAVHQPLKKGNNFGQL